MCVLSFDPGTENSGFIKAIASDLFTEWPKPPEVVIPILLSPSQIGSYPEASATAFSISRVTNTFSSFSLPFSNSLKEAC